MMRLQYWTIGHIENDYVKRIFGRFLFTYLDSFTKLAPQLKNQIKQMGTNVSSIHERLKKLLDDYESDYAIIRDKLSAHRQILSLPETIECWNDIDLISVGYFIDECVEIYHELRILNPTLPTYNDSADYQNTSLAESLKELPIENFKVTLSSDVLALTREKTVGLIPNGEFQHKGSQIASIIDMLRIEYGILNTTNPANKDFDRILKSLIIVDTISLIDNLYPTTTANIVHQEKSFLELGEEVNQIGIKILADAHASLDTSRINRVRQIRNKISAHIDASTNITDLLNQLDQLDFIDIDKISVNQSKLFCSCCEKDVRSKLFLINNMELKDVIAVEDTGAVKKFNE